MVSDFSGVASFVSEFSGAASLVSVFDSSMIDFSSEVGSVGEGCYSVLGADTSPFDCSFTSSVEGLSSLGTIFSSLASSLVGTIEGS